MTRKYHDLSLTKTHHLVQAGDGVVEEVEEGGFGGGVAEAGESLFGFVALLTNALHGVTYSVITENERGNRLEIGDW